MAKSEYIKVRVTDEERAKLEEMIQNGKASTLTDAIRKLAFVKETTTDAYDSVTQYLQTIANLQQDIRTLIYAQIENQKLYEPDVMKIERKIAELSRNAAKFARAVRKVIQ